MMLRGHKAWILLLTFVLGCTQGVVSLAAYAQGKACSASTSCCATKTCPMRAAPVANSKSCHMAGMSHPHQTSPRTIACTCSLSSDESSFNLAAFSDYRFELPRAAWAHTEEVSYRLPIVDPSNILAGYTSPPDHPPKASS